jgi:polyisoprenoid-binding protein YceI
MRFKTALLSAAAAALLIAGAPAQAETFVIDPHHTNVSWKVGHLGFSNVSGKFALGEGTINLDETTPANSSVKVTFKLADLSTGDAKFDTHLKSPDLFNAEKFTTATFESTKVEPTGDKSAKVTGNLTLLGVTKPVTLDVVLNNLGEHPMAKKKAVGFSATSTIKRSEFGLNYALPNVPDEVALDIQAEAAVQ